MTFNELEELKRQARKRGDRDRAKVQDRRERIAIAALQGLLTSETTDDRYIEGEVVKQAVLLADALIAELDKE